MSDLLAKLHQENEELRERVRQLEEIISPRSEPPQGVHLTPTELAIYCQLRTGRLVSREDFMTRIYVDPDDQPNGVILNVLLMRLRRKLAPCGLIIHNRRGQGWQLLGASDGANA